MLRAAIALADEATTDGSLKGKRDWWPLRHLAARMDLSPNTAAAVLRWLEESGWVAKRAGMVTKEGRTPDVRWLTLPIAQESSTALSDGPLLKNGEAIAQNQPTHDSKSGNPLLNVPIQPLGQSVVPSFRSSVETPRSKNPQQIAADIKERIYSNGRESDEDERDEARYLAAVMGGKV
jgi:DNA-binding transcriptional MocR family regulator